ncbi:hypothetical protein [Pseudemcibacter aquimaris]|uniref:hypothetical protein n=1 Tax=Pseudemcibacter aquimaris TaxID=2857064 RepID=UPI0020112159|nr:hypothetical protein [Pseudemcibacter aquimaris]MCC3861626.1 hypothetical protein [Pseudemcibacter aquimaris]WDU58396.1 hypothetical protein KW060_14480 [Pseudemcibacter aquimaris]
MRQYYKYLLILISSVFLFAQTAAAAHDQTHDHAAGECVTCKIVETGHDKVVTVTEIAEILVSDNFLNKEHNVKISGNRFWERSHSRAPPASS